MPTLPRRAGTRLDIPGAIVLFVGLLCLIGPLLFGHDLHWSPWVWLVMAAASSSSPPSCGSNARSRAAAACR